MCDVVLLSNIDCIGRRIFRQNWTWVWIKQSAKKALEKMPREARLRIITAIDLLKDNPAVGGVLKGEFSGLRRIRIGNYRVVYEVHDQELVVLGIRIGHGRDIYR